MVKDTFTLSQNTILKKVSEAVILILTIAIIYMLGSMVIRFVFVEGYSMEPTLHNKDILLVDRITYKFKDVDVGDIIIFPYKGMPSQSYVKRVIAKAGDEVNIIDNNVYINNECANEPYIYETMKQKGDIQFPIIVPDGYCFVMGDNRNNSADSRYTDVGMIYNKDIIGKVKVRIWPLNNLGAL